MNLFPETDTQHEMPHDLQALLRTAAPATAAVTVGVVEADVARGRSALRRRRGRRAGVGLSALAAAGVMASALTATHLAGTPGGSSVAIAKPAQGLSPASGGGATATTSTPSSRSSTAAGLTFVPYHGRQSVGFTLSKLPVGWEVLKGDAYDLILAPRGTKDLDEPGVTSFEGRIGISLNSKDASTPPEGATTVRAHGVEGRLVTEATCDAGSGQATGRVPATLPGGRCDPREVPGDPTKTLWVKQANGTHLLIGVWSGLHWSSDDMAELAAAVHVTGAARQGAG